MAGEPLDHGCSRQPRHRQRPRCASAFWILSLLGFVTAALSFSGVLVPGDAWRPLAVASAMVSIVGIALFFGTWPMFNTLAALEMNIAVLVALVWLCSGRPRPCLASDRTHVHCRLGLSSGLAA